MTEVITNIQPKDTKTNGISIVEEREEPLYSPELLKKITWNSTSMKNGITCSNPGHGIKVRPLCKADFDKGFLQLLAQLTKVGDISREKFEERFNFMKSCPGHYYVTVIEDLEKGKIIGCATLAVEFKFIRGCTMRGRVEDVVVDNDYRGKQLGKLIVYTVTLLAKEVGCYKVGLDCTDQMVKFYNSIGFFGEEGNNTTMVIRF